MTTIKPHCREQLTHDDLGFVTRALSSRPEASDALARLLTDAAARDAALENDRVVQSLLDQPELLRLSPQLYFYVLTRHALAGFDRVIADYVASVLAAFIETERLREAGGGYVTDMLTALQAVSSERAFWIRAQVGNCSLFLSGIFPQHIHHRATRHGAPDIGFYEEVGSANYRLASSHRLAREHELGVVFQTIGDRFSDVRRSLNRMADQYLCLEPLWRPTR